MLVHKADFAIFEVAWRAAQPLEREGRVCRWWFSWFENNPSFTDGQAGQRPWRAPTALCWISPGNLIAGNATRSITPWNLPHAVMVLQHTLLSRLADHPAIGPR